MILFLSIRNACRKLNESNFTPWYLFYFPKRQIIHIFLELHLYKYVLFKPCLSLPKGSEMVKLLLTCFLMALYYLEFFLMQKRGNLTPPH